MGCITVSPPLLSAEYPLSDSTASKCGGNGYKQIWDFSLVTILSFMDVYVQTYLFLHPMLSFTTAFCYGRNEDTVKPLEIGL